MLNLVLLNFSCLAFLQSYLYGPALKGILVFSMYLLLLLTITSLFLIGAIFSDTQADLFTISKWVLLSLLLLDYMGRSKPFL